jgi:uncharacterized membrane protein YphA (DoxX/SURF4 family)
MTGIGMRVLSVVMGVFLLFMGIDKLEWFTDGGAFLSRRLDEWAAAVPPASRWFLETLAIPGIPVFSKLVPLGELLTGAALIAGVRVRIAASVALLMVLTFHVASGVMFRYDYLINGYGPPVIGGLLALAIGGGALPLSLGRARRMPRRT